MPGIISPILLLAFLAAGRAAPVPAREEEAFAARVRVEEETPRHTLYEVRFPSALRSPFPVNDTVWGHLYVPKPARPAGAKPACILVLPVMAAPNVWIELRFVHAFLRRGFAVLWLEMPYQFHRRPHPSVPSGQVFLARSARRLGANFRQSIADARRALTWLGRSGLVDQERIGLFGISLGGMVAAAVYSVDDRPKGAVLLLAGAGFPDLAVNGSLTADFVRRAGIGTEELRRAWQGLDPAAYRERNRGKPVCLVNARSDTVVPRDNALKLKESFPDARQLWVPFGHYSSAVHLLWVRSYAAGEFSRLLFPPGP
ncbi:MAG: alpha/beta hydrolase family protein [Elusimicrobia bacterium]|nr:alpha/beta hydrolase family protein [Elusimicrobiota bacterium]